MCRRKNMKEKKITDRSSYDSMDEMKRSLKTLPVQTLVQSIGLMIEALEEQGKVIRDWDRKDHIVRLVRIIGGEVYVLEERDLKVAGTYEETLRVHRQQEVALRRLCRDLQKECEGLRKQLERERGKGTSGTIQELRG